MKRDAYGVTYVYCREWSKNLGVHQTNDDFIFCYQDWMNEQNIPKEVKNVFWACFAPCGPTE